MVEVYSIHDVEMVEYKDYQRVEKENEKLDKIAKIIHYPECWDTIAYPDITDAINEIFECSECKSKQE